MTGTWRTLPPTVQLLILARAVNRLGACSLPFLATLLIQDGPYTLPDVGLLLGLFGAATIPSRLLGGLLSDRLGPARTMVTGLLSCAACQALLGADLHPSVTLPAVLGLGLAFELYEAPSQALIAAHTPAPAQPLAYGTLGAALAVSAAAAGLLAAAAGPSHLHALFWIDALTCVAAAVLVWRHLRALDPPPPRIRRAPLPRPWRDPALLGLFTLNTVFASVYLQLPAALSFSLVHTGAPVTDAGLLLALSAVIVTLGQPILRRGPAALRQPGTALVGGYALLSVGCLAAALSRTPGHLTGATVVMSLGDLTLLGHGAALVARLAPVDARAGYFAVYGTSWGVAAVVSGPVLMALVETGGTARYWVVAAGTALILAGTQAGFNAWMGARPRAARPVDVG